jgi:surface antigen
MMIRRKVAVLAPLAVLVGFSVPLLADPPAHAPAHGWRKKHDADYVGYTGAHWEHDYDILAGNCDREAIGAVLGAAVGGAIASRVGERPVATLIGAVAGAVIGAKVARELDEADRGCFGHALEIGEVGRTVGWTNISTGVRYELSPRDGHDRNGVACREFMLATVVSGKKSSSTGIACQSQPGVWEIAGV